MWFAPCILLKFVDGCCFEYCSNIMILSKVAITALSLLSSDEIWATILRPVIPCRCRRSIHAIGGDAAHEVSQCPSEDLFWPLWLRWLSPILKFGWSCMLRVRGLPLRPQKRPRPIGGSVVHEHAAGWKEGCGKVWKFPWYFVCRFGKYFSK